MVSPRMVTSSARTVRTSWAPPPSRTASPWPRIVTGTVTSSRGSRYTPAVTTMVSPACARASAAVIVGTGPVWATTMRRLGGPATASSRASTALPMASPPLEHRDRDDAAERQDGHPPADAGPRGGVEVEHHLAADDRRLIAHPGHLDRGMRVELVPVLVAPVPEVAEPERGADCEQHRPDIEQRPPAEQ